MQKQYIILNKVGRDMSKVRVCAMHPFFDAGDVIYKVTDDEIRFTHPTLDYRGNTTRPAASNQDGWRRFDITANIPPGKYEISEDSDEDLLIIDITTEIK